MQENLVIVESPAKAKTIEKFLGKDFHVMSSYGHIRDLKRRTLSVDAKTMKPEYEIPEDKAKIVKELRTAAAKADKVWLASDEDREGEAISWHLCECLGLDEQKTSRIVFHEITKPAILAAIESPRHLDMHLVDAQQARRVLDRIVGFKLSPVLWRKVKPSLSAGRVQSVAVRLIVEREREIQQFEAEPFFRVGAIFTIEQDGHPVEIKAEASRRFADEEEARAFLETCREATFRVGDIQQKPLHRSPAPPFTTSTMQQEAARRLGFTVSQTMMVAQHLYENGLITYMRTDSVNLSQLCITQAEEVIAADYGREYSTPRRFHTKSKGAQEAHEAIRPTDLSRRKIEGTSQEKRLYDLIWKRALASQMSDARIEKTQAEIEVSGSRDHFTASGEVVAFEGFMKAWASEKSEEQADQRQLPTLAVGQAMERREITATERYTQAPARYTEATLVHKLEELGIGRPSTYAPTISTIQQREYVVKGDRPGQERKYQVITLRAAVISAKQKVELVGADKGKLLPTDIGTVVNDFLVEYFPAIMDYNFTAQVEQQFDLIAEGKEDWLTYIKTFYDGFDPVVEKTLNAKAEHKAGEREVGQDPATGKPVFVKIGRFGPVVQIGSTDDKEKPRFAHLPKELSIETITLEQCLELFKLPKRLGQYEGHVITVGSGRFGPYVQHNKKYVSIPKGEDPMSVDLERAVQLIVEKRRKDEERNLKAFKEDDELFILKGRFGPYIQFEKQNYRIPKERHADATDLTYDECMEIVNTTQPSGARKKAKKS